MWGRHSIPAATGPDHTKLVSPTLWELVKLPNRSKVRVCPTAEAMLPPVFWETTTTSQQFQFSYRYSFLIGGLDTTVQSKSNKPFKLTGPPSHMGPSGDAFWLANPLKSVKNSSETLMFIDYPQVVIGAQNSNAGMTHGVLRANNPLIVNQHQAMTEVAAVHSRKQTQGTFKFFPDGLPIPQGYVNIAYCDGSVRGVEVIGGNINNAYAGAFAVRPEGPWPDIRAQVGGSRGIIEGTRFDPNQAP
jgi:prepilin-type processing-associated H-X9-DG protein